MTENVQQATHTGTLQFGDAEIPCAVLQNGTRVISSLGLMKALKRRWRGRYRSDLMPNFLAANNLAQFIDDETRKLLSPIEYVTPAGGRRDGYRADLLPRVCEVYLQARDANVITERQRNTALASEIIVRSLAKVGIVALVDEATGYQADRDREALHRLLAVYLSEERLRWAKRFPDEYYRQLYRLKAWDFPSGTKRNPMVGKITNNIVYDKLPPGVLDKLRVLNPVDKNTGRRRAKHHQYLSIDVGQPDLNAHLLQLIAVMRVSPNWRIFERNFARAFPNSQEQMELFDETDDDENVEDNSAR